MRLWGARALREFDLDEFNSGDYIGAIEARARSENICRVLYPNDNFFEGQALRLSQEYFFVSATLQDIVRRYKKRYELFDRPLGLDAFDRFAEKVAIQLNDTHPALAIPELMRILVDEEGLDFDEAWDVTTGTFGYTNHTVMPEALERWPASLLGSMLPRHLQLIYEINERFLETREAAARRRRCPAPADVAHRGGRRAARPDGACSRSSAATRVNGVAALHTEILKTDVFRDFHELWPDKINNKTNGVTPRRWLLKSNPDLSGLISNAIGDGWPVDLSQLAELAPLAGDAAFGEAWRAVKRRQKEALVGIIREQYTRRDSDGRRSIPARCSTSR